VKLAAWQQLQPCPTNVIGHATSVITLYPAVCAVLFRCRACTPVTVCALPLQHAIAAVACANMPLVHCFTCHASSLVCADAVCARKPSRLLGSLIVFCRHLVGNNSGLELNHGRASLFVCDCGCSRHRRCCLCNHPGSCTSCFSRAQTRTHAGLPEHSSRHLHA
jgi:hypothetical protein